jgi:hypothetical protein
MESSLEDRIAALESRNRRVEQDKAWETSNARRLSLVCLTYIVVSLFMRVIRVEHPLISALIPSLGFFLSTLTLRWLKERWVAGKK